MSMICIQFVDFCPRFLLIVPLWHLRTLRVNFLIMRLGLAVQTGQRRFKFCITTPKSSDCTHTCKSSFGSSFSICCLNRRCRPDFRREECAPGDASTDPSRIHFAGAHLGSDMLWPNTNCGVAWSLNPCHVGDSLY